MESSPDITWKECLCKTAWTAVGCIWQNVFFRQMASLFVVTFVFLFPVLCYNRHYSLYCSNGGHKKALLISQNDESLSAAEDYLRTLNRTQKVVEGHLHPPGGRIDVAFMIITMTRRTGEARPQFLTQTLARLLQVTENDRRRGSHMNYLVSLCNVASAPENHTEAIRLSTFVHSVSKYHNDEMRRRAARLVRIEKEKQDYVFCLKKSLEFQPRTAS